MHVRVKAVIFDMDGVITDTMPCHFEVWRDIFVREGLDVCREDIYKREGQKGIESVKEVFKEHGRSCATEYARNLLVEKEARFKEIFKCRFITGSRTFLKTLHRREFKLALVTGTSRSEAVKLLPPSIFGLFSATVCGCDVQNGKPHPEPYLQALKKLSLKPSEAVVIENAPFGIRSAKAAGLSCLAIATSLPQTYLEHADAVFASFKELTSNVRFAKALTS